MRCRDNIISLYNYCCVYTSYNENCVIIAAACYRVVANMPYNFILNCVRLARDCVNISLIYHIALFYNISVVLSYYNPIITRRLVHADNRPSRRWDALLPKSRRFFCSNIVTNYSTVEIVHTLSNFFVENIIL